MGPVYAGLQKQLQANLKEVSALIRSEPAPLAVGVTQLRGIDFQKFASTGPFIDLVQQQKEKEQEGTQAIEDCQQLHC